MPANKHHPQNDVFKWINGKKQPVTPYNLAGHTPSPTRIDSLHFDGTKLTVTATNGLGQIQRLIVPADAGKRQKDGSFDYSSTKQQVPNKGPIPEGTYTINPQAVQRPSLMDTLIGIAGKNPIKNFGKYPGSTAAWGQCRIPITPTPEQERKTNRSGFTIHGGWKRGSAGCIDITQNDRKFCDFIEKFRGKNQNSVPLTVDYSKIKGKEKKKETTPSPAK
ncbi:MAG: DUF2778 domain-containing protein [Elusimicrobiaceae bacterium]|nr:DUF2778 domain-containing protein [Elusimicrobiaceae bacterium]